MLILIIFIYIYIYCHNNNNNHNNTKNDYSVVMMMLMMLMMLMLMIIILLIIILITWRIILFSGGEVGIRLSFPLLYLSAVLWCDCVTDDNRVHSWPTDNEELQEACEHWIQIVGRWWDEAGTRRIVVRSRHDNCPTPHRQTTEHWPTDRPTDRPASDWGLVSASTAVGHRRLQSADTPPRCVWTDFGWHSKTARLAILVQPGFEPGTFRVWGERDSHYTTGPTGFSTPQTTTPSNHTTPSTNYSNQSIHRTTNQHINQPTLNTHLDSQYRLCNAECMTLASCSQSLYHRQSTKTVSMWWTINILSTCANLSQSGWPFTHNRHVRIDDHPDTYHHSASRPVEPRSCVIQWSDVVLVVARPIANQLTHSV